MRLLKRGTDEVETRMRRFLLASALTLTAVGGAFAEDPRDVMVVNGTGYNIKFLGFNNPATMTSRTTSSACCRTEQASASNSILPMMAACGTSRSNGLSRVARESCGAMSIYARFRTLTLRYDRTTDQTSADVE